MIKRCLTLFCVILPLILLVYDFINSPSMFSSRIIKNKVSTTMLIEKKYAPMGVLSGHNVGIVFDKIRNGESNSHVNGNSGFVISAFVTEGDDISLSELGLAVKEKIAAYSAENAEKLVSFLKKSGRQKPGSVASLSLVKQNNSSFPFNYLLIVFLPSDIHQNSELLDSELLKVTREAELLKLSTLVVPVIGFSWRDRNSTDLDGFFSAALKSLETRKYPSNYLVNFYSDWPTYVVEDAVHSFNTAWDDLTTEPTKITHLRLRLILIMTTYCLWDIYYLKKKMFNFARYLVIVSFFYASASAIAEFLKLFFTEDTIIYGSCLLVALSVVTAFFISIARYSVEGFFKRWRQHP